MKQKIFKVCLAITAIAFIIIFCVLMIPPVMNGQNIIDAFAMGFVNPFSSGYAMDAILCWVVLLIWVLYEYPKVKYGWVCLLLGLMPGVVVGFALYLVLRMNQIEDGALGSE